MIIIECSPWVVNFDAKTIYTENYENSKSITRLMIDSIYIEDKYRIRKNDLKWTKQMIDSVGIREYAKYKKRWHSSKHFRSKLDTKRFNIFIKDTMIAEIRKIENNDSSCLIYFQPKLDGRTEIIAISKDLADTCYSTFWVKDKEIFTTRP